MSKKGEIDDHAPLRFSDWQKPRDMRRENSRQPGSNPDATEVYLAWLIAGLTVGSLFLVP